MSVAFERLAPFLKDPLILIGFFLFIAFSFSRYLVKKGIIVPLTKELGYRILKLILLYGFIIGLLIIVLGFILKRQALIVQSQAAASIELMLRDFLKNVHSISEEKKNEIVVQMLEGYRSGVLSEEQIDAKVEEIKASLTSNQRDTTNLAFSSNRSNAEGSTERRNNSEAPQSVVTETKRNIENKQNVDQTYQPANEERSTFDVIVPSSNPVADNSQAEIKITLIPRKRTPLDDQGTIGGKISGIDWQDCRVVLFSHNHSKWYIQPRVDSPYTLIKRNGHWETNIHLGDKYAALLVRSSYRPPAITLTLPKTGDGVLAVANVSDNLYTFAIEGWIDSTVDGVVKRTAIVSESSNNKATFQFPGGFDECELRFQQFTNGLPCVKVLVSSRSGAFSYPVGTTVSSQAESRERFEFGCQVKANRLSCYLNPGEQCQKRF